MTTAVFNFNVAVTEARADYPKETRKTTFVDLDTDEAAAFAALKKWGRRNAPWMFITKTSIQKHIEADTSYALVTPWASLIGMHTSDLLTEELIYDVEKDKAITFYHELGHIVVPNGALATNNEMAIILSESVADLFTSIYGLRQGWLTKENIAELSNERAAGALNGDIEHSSFFALDWLVENADNYDWQAMSPAEIKEFVNTHAEKLSPKPQEFSALHKSFKLVTSISDDYYLSDDEETSYDSDLFYQRIINLHDQAPAQSFTHKLLAKILTCAVESTAPFIPDMPEKLDQAALLDKVRAKQNEPAPLPKKNWLRKAIGF